MKKELEEIILNMLKKSLEIAEKTGEFVMDQAPDILREFYMWHTSKAIFYMLLGIVFYLLGRYIPHLGLKKEDPKEHYTMRFFSRYGEGEHGNGSGIIAWGCFILLGVIGALFFFINAYNLVYILVAPKVYLIEYFVNRL